MYSNPMDEFHGNHDELYTGIATVIKDSVQDSPSETENEPGAIKK